MLPGQQIVLGSYHRLHTLWRQLYCTVCCMCVCVCVLISLISVPVLCHTVVKKRLVKLIVNFLFYFRTDEEEVSWILIWTPAGFTASVLTACTHCHTFVHTYKHMYVNYVMFIWQPIGALLLEQCRVEREDSQTFSIGELHFTLTWTAYISWHSDWLHIQVFTCHCRGKD